MIYNECHKYSAKCPKCYEVIKFKINTNDFSISGNCRNGHHFNNMSFFDFKYDCIKETNSSNVYCFRCYSSINEQINNFICEKCNHIFCNTCINIHSKKEKHFKKKSYNNYNILCKLHNSRYNLFCKDCKINICNECKDSHKNHITKSFLDEIPSHKDIESIKNKCKNNYEKISNILNKINKYKEDLEKRYENFTNYLIFLRDSINNKLLKEFNYSFFDYYNYKNLKYCENYLDKEKLIKNENYLEYLIYGKYQEKEEETDNISQSSDVINNENEINIIKPDNKEKFHIKNYKDLMYFKNNIFFQREYSLGWSETLNFYELKQDSFQQINTFPLNKFGKTKSIKVSKYTNNIFINYDRKKQIKILEYDINNNSITLIKNQIKSQKSYLDNSFLDLIDDKDDNIITSDQNEISLWRKHKKIFAKIQHIHGYYDQLYNVSDTIFCGSKLSNNYIYFFGHEKFELIKSIDIKNDYDFIGTTKNKLLCINNYVEKILILIDTNYFEIVQKIEYENDLICVNIKDNYLLSFYYQNDILKIKEDLYDEKDNYFKEYKFFITGIKESDSLQVLLTDKEYYFIKDYDKIFVLNCK